MWFQRDILSSITRNSDPIQILRGPRQCGKTSLWLHLDSRFRELSLDDPHLRDLAQRDPELFLNQFKDEPLIIDEAQYAPNLFPSLKRRVDLLKRDHGPLPGVWFRLTGSNQILMDRNVKESLAGRASFFDLNTLSISEIQRQQPLQIQQILFKGGWPELYTNPNKDPKKFLDDYITSYVEKDIVLSAGIQKARLFLQFVKLLAGRVGELVEYATLSKELGIDSKTVKDWISVLEKMQIIGLVPPYFSNLSNRLIKSPKIYFMDTGLACRLQGWADAAPILTSPQQGHLFENLVFAEIQKLNQNLQLGWKIFHWRSRAGEEIDFLIEVDPQTRLFVEAKVSPQSAPHCETLPEVRKVFKDRVPPALLCHQEGEHVLDNRVPIRQLAETLLSRLCPPTTANV